MIYRKFGFVGFIGITLAMLNVSPGNCSSPLKNPATKFKAALHNPNFLLTNKVASISIKNKYFKILTVSGMILP